MKETTTKPSRFSLGKLSLKQRLPLFISLLLVCVIILFSLTTYYGILNAATKRGEERLQAVTAQIAGMINQSIHNSSMATRALQNKDTVRTFFSSPQLKQEEVLNYLTTIKKDSTWISTALLDATGNLIISTKSSPVVADTRLLIKNASFSTDSVTIGEMHFVNDTIFCPVLAKVNISNELQGYILVWRILRSSKANLDQVLNLMGSGAALFIANADGSLWTNMITRVDHPPIDSKNPGKIYHHKNTEGKPVIAAAERIKNTDWILLIEFPKSAITNTASLFLKNIIIIGLIILAIGIYAAFVMSKRLIAPLNQLTNSAVALAKNNYSDPVIVNRNDELGRLADAFNIMAEKVNITQQALEEKVRTRTMQLEAANREMEAFTYSVSHDLRAPLRGIMGFAAILEEDYASQLDDEAKRITTVIKSSALNMGNLIDDLLNFSRLGRQEIVKASIDTNALVQEVINNQDPKNKVRWKVDHLPESFGDLHTIRQVWINLLSNAIKYSRNMQQPEVEIGSFPVDNQTGFFVKDNGAGFDQSYHHKLFQVFQRLHSVNEFEGTGVGLAIVEKIISRHGGNVWAESEVGKGAKFYFTLPFN